MFSKRSNFDTAIVAFLFDHLISVISSSISARLPFEASMETNCASRIVKLKQNSIKFRFNGQVS